MRFLPALAPAIILLAALSLAGTADSPLSLATSPPSAQRFSIDMNPSQAPANTATSLGTREACAAIIENNVLDADEDFTDTVELDVTVTGIPASNAMIGYLYTLLYPSWSVRITYSQPMILNPVGIEPVVDPPDADGSFDVSIADPGLSGVSGSGVLNRIRIETFPGSLAGVFPLALSNAAHVDTTGIAHAPDALDSAIIEVSGGCGGLGDIEMVSMSLTSANNPIPIGANNAITVDENVRNNSIYPGNTDARTTFDVPGGCTVNGQAGTVVVTSALGIVPDGGTVSHQEVANLRCTNAGSFQMPVTACGVLNDPNSVDITHSNDCKAQTLSFDVFVPPGTDSDSDRVYDLDEFNCGVSAFGISVFPERLNGLDDDGDTAIDEALPPGSESWDCDGDGYVGLAEAYVFGSEQDQDRCGLGNWPPEFVSGGVPNSTDRVDIGDLISFLAPTRHLNTNVGDNPGNVRWDIVPGKGVFTTDINVTDLISLVTVKPPLFSGVRAFNGLPCSLFGD